MKRLLDLVLSGLALLLLAPLLIPIVIALRFSGEGEIFYRQQRIGKNGKPFGLLKFATMLKDSPNIGTGLLTTKADPRVLPLGRFLRKTKINELPQLINVLLGDMSIIGPRPQAPKHFDVFPKHVREIIIQVPPGLSGIGSIVFRDEESILANSKKGYERCYAEDIAPYKGELEIWYVGNQSLWLDALLTLITMLVVVNPGGQPYKTMLTGLPDPPKELADFI